MPNQLAQFKKRTSLVEHEAVLAVLSELAREDGVTVADLFRKGAREMIARRARDTVVARRLHKVIMAYAPSPPAVLNNRAQVSRFKREQRQFDELLQRLHLADSTELQERNSVVSSSTRVKLVSNK
ncbi:MAG: hypothetical protein WD490_01600 [Opitutales bacterium]